MAKAKELVISGASTFFRNGYPVIPLISNGSCCFTNYQNLTFTEAEVEGWKNSYSVASALAFVCGHSDEEYQERICALDVDVDDGSTVRNIVVKLCETMNLNASDMFIRCRNGTSRVALLFSAASDVSEIPYWNSDIFINKDVEDTPENKHLREGRIEFKNNRTHISVHGFKRDSDDSYFFHPKAKSPFGNKAEELPVMDVATLTEFMTSLSECFGTKWSRLRKTAKRGSKGGRHETFESASLEREFTREEVDALIEETMSKHGLDGDHREEWVRMGMALHKFFKASEEGLMVWNDWAKQFDNYTNLRDHRQQWATFVEDGKVSMTTISRTIRRRRRTAISESVKQEQKYSYDTVPDLESDDLLDWMMKNYVFIQKGDSWSGNKGRVGDLGTNVKESLNSYQELLNATSNRTIEMSYRTPSGKDVSKPVPVLQMWFNSKDRIEAYDTIYIPGGSRIISGRDIEVGLEKGYYNMYIPPLVRVTEKRDLIKHFFDHMQYLFPDDGDKWMINWIAQMVQNPSKRHRVNPLSISIYEGTGRGWLVELLTRLVGQSNFSTVLDINSIGKAGAKSGYLDDKVLMVINEVNIRGSGKWDIHSKLKSMVSDDYQEIDVKFGKQCYNQRIYTRIFLQSNYVDGLVIHPGDSRIQPFVNRNPPRSQSYYFTLYGLLGERTQYSDFVDQVYSYMMQYNVDEKLLTRSIHTKDRQHVVASCQSITSLAFMEFRAVMGVDYVFTDEMLDDFMNQVIAERSDDSMDIVNNKELKKLRKQVEQTGTKVMLGDEVTSVYCFGGVDNKGDIGVEIMASEKLIRDYFRNMRSQVKPQKARESSKGELKKLKEKYGEDMKIFAD